MPKVSKHITDKVVDFGVAEDLAVVEAAIAAHMQGGANR